MVEWLFGHPPTDLPTFRLTPLSLSVDSPDGFCYHKKCIKRTEDIIYLTNLVTVIQIE